MLSKHETVGEHQSYFSGATGQLTADGDVGVRRVLDVSSAYDADSVYEVNAVARDSYVMLQQ